MTFLFNCIVKQYDHRLLALSIFLCLFAVITARAMVMRARVSQGRIRNIWLVSAGLVSGVGIWGTHFVAILAYNLGIPMTFDPWLTAASVGAAVVLAGAGFVVASRKDRATLGGIICGAAICAMHYIGMGAIRLAADPVWNIQLVIASFVIGAAFGGLSGYFGSRSSRPVHSMLSVTCFSLAIIGAHFSGMAAVRFVPNPARTIVTALDPASLAVAVSAGVAFVLALAMILSLVDGVLHLRSEGEAQRLRKYIAELENTKETLQKTSVDLSGALDAAEAANASKSAFLASMSHELRTPLNAIIGFSEIMQLGTFGPLGSPRYKEYMGNIHDSGIHLLTLINDILDVSRIDAGKEELHEETFDLAAKIANAVAMVSGQAAKADVSVIVDLAQNLPLFIADKRRIRQILLNLLSNGLKFTPAGGKVSVRAFLTQEGLTLQVADTGIGIAENNFSKVLEPFGQIDSSLARKYEGTGLGLPLTRQMVELHGGTLELVSTLGQGTTITILFPSWRTETRIAA
jgi:signal transduction histidine kinase